MAPDVRFGKPAINGISTEALWEHVESGEDVTEVAEAFDLDVDDVRSALPTKRRPARRDAAGKAGCCPLLLRRRHPWIGQGPRSGLS
jgi:uncharacterized protein (DUF433 family)